MYNLANKTDIWPSMREKWHCWPYYWRDCFFLNKNHLWCASNILHHWFIIVKLINILLLPVVTIVVFLAQSLIQVGLLFLPKVMNGVYCFLGSALHLTKSRYVMTRCMIWLCIVDSSGNYLSILVWHVSVAWLPAFFWKFEVLFFYPTQFFVVEHMSGSKLTYRVIFSHHPIIMMTT